MPIQINEVVIRTTAGQNGNEFLGNQAMSPEPIKPDEQTVLAIIEEFLQDKNER